MRYIRILFFLFFANATIAQLSVDLGVRKQVSSFYFSQEKAFFSPSHSDVYINDSYFARFNIHRIKWIFSAEISYMPKTLIIDTTNSWSETDYYYGMGPPGESGLITQNESVSLRYNSVLNLNYLGLRLGVDRKFFDRKINLLLGASLNSDLKIMMDEDVDYLETTTTTRTDWNGTTINTTTNNEPFYRAGQAASLLYFNIGLNTAFRYNFDRIYCDLFLNNTFSWHGRYSSSSYDFFPAYYDMKFWKVRYNFEYGIRIGYTFKSKD